jgi:hypothetical protein
MISIREIALLARIQLDKDSKAIGAAFWLIYNPVVLAFFVWTAIDPESVFSFIPVSSQISPASHFIGEFAVANTFLVPFVFYTSAIKRSFEQRAGVRPFVVPRVLSIDVAAEKDKKTQLPVPLPAHTKNARQLFWVRVFSCLTLTLFSFLVAYLTHLTLRLFGPLGEDRFAPILLGGRFLLFVTSLTVLTSITAVGIGPNMERKWPIAAAILLAVLFGGIVVDAIQGRHDRGFLIKFVETYGLTIHTPLALIALSVILAWLFTGSLRRHSAEGH